MQPNCKGCLAAKLEKHTMAAKPERLSWQPNEKCCHDNQTRKAAMAAKLERHALIAHPWFKMYAWNRIK